MVYVIVFVAVVNLLAATKWFETVSRYKWYLLLSSHLALNPFENKAELSCSRLALSSSLDY